MVVSVLNATSNSLLSKQALKSSLEWHSPPHNSTSETDQPTCLLNFDACDQRRHSSPVQVGLLSFFAGKKMLEIVRVVFTTCVAALFFFFSKKNKAIKLHSNLPEIQEKKVKFT